MDEYRYINEITEDYLSQISDGEILKVENETGYGLITNYTLFDGVHLCYNDIHMEYSTSETSFENMIQINHCHTGGWEWIQSNKKSVCGTIGDLCISEICAYSGKVYYLTNLYKGISVIIDYSIVDKEYFFNEYNINLDKIKRLVNGEEVKVYRSNERISHIFYEFYYAQNHFSRDYLKIKTLELLLFISNIDWDLEEEKHLNISRENFEKIKEIRKMMVENLNIRYTAESLSIKYGISKTNLKSWFKNIYGDSIHRYIKKVRLERSKELLKEGKMSVAEVALEIGYNNPAKFSTVFKKEYGVVPSKYCRD